MPVKEIARKMNISRTNTATKMIIPLLNKWSTFCRCICSFFLSPSFFVSLLSSSPFLLRSKFSLSRPLLFHDYLFSFVRVSCCVYFRCVYMRYVLICMYYMMCELASFLLIFFYFSFFSRYTLSFFFYYICMFVSATLFYFVHQRNDLFLTQSVTSECKNLRKYLYYNHWRFCVYNSFSHRYIWCIGVNRLYFPTP